MSACIKNEKAITSLQNAIRRLDEKIENFNRHLKDEEISVLERDANVNHLEPCRDRDWRYLNPTESDGYRNANAELLIARQALRHELAQLYLHQKD